MSLLGLLTANLSSSYYFKFFYKFALILFIIYVLKIFVLLKLRVVLITSDNFRHLFFAIVSYLIGTSWEFLILKSSYFLLNISLRLKSLNLWMFLTQHFFSLKILLLFSFLKSLIVFALFLSCFYMALTFYILVWY